MGLGLPRSSETCTTSSAYIVTHHLLYRPAPVHHPGVSSGHTASTVSAALPLSPITSYSLFLFSPPIICVNVLSNSGPHPYSLFILGLSPHPCLDAHPGHPMAIPSPQFPPPALCHSLKCCIKKGRSCSLASEAAQSLVALIESLIVQQFICDVWLYCE